MEAALYRRRKFEALLPEAPLIFVEVDSVIRFFDIVFSLLGLVVGFPLLVLLTMIGLFDTGSPIFRQVRVLPMQSWQVTLAVMPLKWI